MNLQLEDFSGPLDLLLHLVRIKEVNIYEVNIKEIIDQYLEFINSLDKSNIDVSSEYLVMAAELIHLKSKMLINIEYELDEEETYELESVEDLRDKLIEYEKYKKVCDSFKDLENNRLEYYTKIPESLSEYSDGEKLVNSDVDLEDLVNAFLEMQKRVFYKRPVTTKVTKKEISIKDRIYEIRNILDVRKKLEFSELFDSYTKEDVVVTFLSILDMTKGNEILLTQEKVFGNIYIEKK